VQHFPGLPTDWSWLAVPVSAVGAAVCGWFLGFGQKAGNKFAEKFGEVFGQAAADWIRDRKAPFKLRYREHLRELARHIDIKGFAQDIPYALELLDVFVELSLDAQSLRNISANPIRPLPEELKQGRHAIWDYLAAPNQRLAIIGPPGSGKTTLVRHLILAACSSKRWTKHPAAMVLPILLEIRKHAKSIGEKPEYSLEDAARNQLGSFGVKAPAKWFERHLEKGACLVLIDGLDEVADEELRSAVVAWVDQQISTYPMNRFLITSRPNGYRSNPVCGANTLEVQPLVPDQVRRFVHAWYLATEVAHHLGNKNQTVRSKAAEGADGLLGKLRQSRDLGDLAANPLLLTMIATVHRYRGSLPGSRVELYADICAVFFGRRRQARGLDFDLRPDQKQSVFEPLAYHMMCRRIRDIPAAEAADVVQAPLASVRPATPSLQFLKAIESSSGLFVERENGIWGFAHLTVQEYLAAVHVRTQDLASQLTGRVHQTWWHETIRLYVAQSDATKVIEACLAHDSPVVESLVLAIQCLEEAKKVDPALRHASQSMIARFVESEKAEERLPIAEALLHLRLARMVALDENRFISGYITNAEYQLFLDDLKARGEYRQPDHWAGYRFPPGSGNEPVTGVRTSDAAAFAEWLSSRAETGDRYRLPLSADEAKASGEQRELNLNPPGCWTRSPDGRWAIAGALVPARDLARDLARDFDLALALARALDLARDLALDRDPARDVDCVLDLALDRDPARELARALDLTLARDHGRDLARARARGLDRDLALALALARDLDLARDLALALARDRARDLARAFDLALARDLDLDRARALARDLDRALARALDRELERTFDWLADRNRSTLETRVAGRYQMAPVLLFLTRYAGYACWLLAALQQQILFSLPRIAPGDRPAEFRRIHETARDSYLDLYITCTFHELRCEGKIPVLGGIRVVKDPLNGESHSIDPRDETATT
jgi:energy-coupling factor transporter ATP-binding protein EcfA2